MTCSICRIKNKELRCAIEEMLAKNCGTLSSIDRSQLIAGFPEEQEAIEKIDNSDCEIHFNFHQSASRVAHAESIAEEAGKDEATVLYEMLNSQAATFNVLSNKINAALKSAEDGALTGMIIHPNLTQFYETLSTSMRETVHEISELNLALNGKKDGALEGLKALASALTNSRNAGNAGNAEGISSEMTTAQFDD